MRKGVAFSVLLLLASCGSHKDPDAGGSKDANPVSDGSFTCWDEDSEACLNDAHYWCEREGEFLSAKSDDCKTQGKVCHPDLWCVVCHPGERGCIDGDVARCLDDGSAWEIIEDCVIEEGDVCRDGACENLCALAVTERSYTGCEFYAADLDNAVAEADASAQPYAVMVSNPGEVETEVWVEINTALPGEAPVIEEVERTNVLPGDLEVFQLPRREVDGSSSNASCSVDARVCSGAEVCVCSHDDTQAPCYCRVSRTATGRNDGTHTALTSNAYRIRSILPIIAYQANPLNNVRAFSNDASLLLPVSAIGETYSVVSWPQTLANDPDHPTSDATDFDHDREDEDQRSFLTIIGTDEATDVTVTLGAKILRMVGGDGIPASFAGDVLEFEIGPFDVVNLETAGLNADFTGSRVVASAPVSVFVGSEASDAPRFSDYSMRLCCADHLEEQLFADWSLGRSFSIARMPARGPAINTAFLDPSNSVAEPNEPEWARVLAVGAGTTTITTTLAAPYDRFELDQYEDVILRADQDFLLEADRAIAVLQVMASQGAIGIDFRYPGGDPAMVVVPPIEQYRSHYVFLTPDLYAFDFVTITASAGATVQLDGYALDDLGCVTSAADGIRRQPSDPPPERVIHRCQLSFPDIYGVVPNLRVDDGVQNDGVHTLEADAPVGIIIWGFDSYVSYAYAGGLNVEVIN